MPKLIVAINGFMEEALLPECLRSIRSNFKDARIVFWDGAYRPWIEQVKILSALHIERGQRDIADAVLRFAIPVSSDNTVDICKQYGAEVIMPPMKDGEYIPWESEAAKRNQFFKVGETDDWVFWLDADERIEGTIDITKLTGDVYNVMLRRDDTVPPYQVMRLYRQQPTIKIEGAHHAIWIEGKLIKRDEQRLLSGCQIFHKYNERGERDKIRMFCKGSFYRWLCGPDGEGPFRAEHGI